MDVPVEVGETAEQRAIVESRDVGQFRQTDERQPDTDHAVAAHGFEREAINGWFHDRGAAQPLRGARSAVRV